MMNPDIIVAEVRATAQQRAKTDRQIDIVAEFYKLRLELERALRLEERRLAGEL